MGKSIIPKITKDDRELIRRSINTMLWAEREQCVKVARDLYVIAGPDGKAKKFDGDWNDFVAWVATLSPREKPLGLDTYERLEAEAQKLLKKLED